MPHVESLEIPIDDVTLIAKAFSPLGSGRFPAVLLAPTWAGRDAFVEGHAERLAEAGYVAVALDVYGNGQQGGSPEGNRALMQPLMSDRSALSRRVAASLERVAALPQVDATRVSAIGFCFGGLTVLDAARAGLPLRAVVSFHGLLGPPEPPLARGAGRPEVVVLHGWADPMAPPNHATALATELTTLGLVWDLHGFGHTLHGFSNPAVNNPAGGVQYVPRAAEIGWLLAHDALARVSGGG